MKIIFLLVEQVVLSNVKNSPLRYTQQLRSYQSSAQVVNTESRKWKF